MTNVATADRSLFTARVAALALSFVVALIIIGGWYLFEFDLALICYGLATVLSSYAFTLRLSLWYQRPATCQYYRRAMQHILNPSNWQSKGPQVITRATAYFGANVFVAKRGLMRWFAHWPIMLGCVMAWAIAFPLVFGWVWFSSDPQDFNNYILMVFHLKIMAFAVDSFFAFMLFHGLVWASFPVILGVSVAFIRRLRNRGDLATQSFADDFMPLIALMAISLSGLMLAVSYTWFAGMAHSVIAWLHATIVIVTILWLPYSKLMHVPQRSLKLAQMITSVCDEERALCARCGADFASRAQVEDLKLVEERLGFSFANDSGHYQDICPRCRRANLVLAQGRRWQSETVLSMHVENG